MKLRVDFSIFAGGDTFGYADGQLEFDQVPKQGDLVDVLEGRNLPRDLPGFTGKLSVTKVGGFERADGDWSTTIFLDDVVISSLEDSKFLAEFLESEIGLFVNKYEENI